MATFGATLQLTEEEKVELAKALEEQYWRVNNVLRNYRARLETAAVVRTEKRLDLLANIYLRLTGKYMYQGK